jgi:hypothetical protein
LAFSVLDHEKLIILQTIIHAKIQVEITLYNLEAGFLLDV